MRAYLDMMKYILDHGEESEDRTGVGTRSVFGYQMRIPLHQGFPLLTTKKLFLRGILAELLWFLRGQTDASILQEQGVHIWDAWATPEACARFGRPAGELGPIYGHQWRRFGATPRPDGGYHKDGFDQIQALLQQIRTQPASRRLIVSGWNPKEAEEVALPPCHTLMQFYVRKNRISCQLYQRSADAFLGVPFNIASYALLTAMIAHLCDLVPHEFIHTFGDLHLYNNHLEQARLQLEREPRPLPKLRILQARERLEDFQIEDFQIEDYHPHPAIKAPIAV
jgi:thymidylate synthase